jgi:hypothetical protein
VIAAFLGGLIGWERRSADRPAGIRTMSLVSLGACLFSICSAFAFIQGPMNWDGSRELNELSLFVIICHCRRFTDFADTIFVGE